MKDRIKRWFHNPENAQSASELAVFGSVLIFVIGTILRTGLTASQSSNSQLRAFRMAMTESFKTAQGAYNGDHPSSGRTNASIFIIQDVLSADASDPRGSRNRIPLFAQGSAAFTNHLLMTTDWNEQDNLTVSDIIVNGQRFPLVLANFVTYNVYDGNGNLNYPVCGDFDAQPIRKPKCNDSQQFPYCSTNPPIGTCWEPECILINVPDCAGDPDCCDNPSCNNCSGGNTGNASACTMNFTYVSGCLRMHTKIPNFANSKDWCTGLDEVGVGPSSCPKNLPIWERFDLNLNKVPGEIDPKGPSPDDDRLIDVPNDPVTRDQFGWQWFLIAGVGGDDSNVKIKDSFGNVMKGIKIPHPKSQQNLLVDVDGDYKEEYILATKTNPYGVITQFMVIDPQKGDLDPTIDDSDKGFWKRFEPDPGPCPQAPRGPCDIGKAQLGQDLNGACVWYRCVKEENGLLDDLKMYSFTKPGTYLRVKQGQLFVPGSEYFIRNTTHQDHIDLVERVFRLSNNTHRFCTDDSPPVPQIWGDTGFARDWGLSGMVNPVEACGQCFSPANIDKTCFESIKDRLTEHEDHLIFIRSRIKDMRGHRWLTRTDL